MRQEPNTRTAQRWVLALTSAGALMVTLDQLVVSTALNTIRHDLHASIETLAWTVNAFSLSFAVLLMTGAALGDRLGRRAVFVTGLVVFTLASAGCAVAPGVGWLIAARVVQGAGAALVYPLALALLSAAYPVEVRGRAIGLFTALTALGVAGGPLVGGAVTQGLAWRWIFGLNLPIGLVVIPLALVRIPESYGPKARIDAGGLVLFTGGALGLVWGLVRGNPAGWGSAEVLTALIAGALLLAGFVGWELRVREPMLPMRFFRAPAFSAGNGAAFLLTGALIGMVFFLSQYLQQGLGYGPLAAGLRTLPWTFLIFVVAPIAGARTNAVGARLLVCVGLSMQAAGFGWIALNTHSGRGYLSSVPALVIAGVGVSMALPAVQSSVMTSVPRAALGQASGTLGAVRQLGGVFGVAVLAAIFAAHGSYTSPAAFDRGAAPAFWVAAAMSLLGAAIGLAAPGRRRPEPIAQPAGGYSEEGLQHAVG